MAKKDTKVQEEKVDVSPEVVETQPEEQTYTESEVQKYIDIAVKNAENKVRQELAEKQSIPFGYIHIDEVVAFPNVLKARGEFTSHDREKSLRWFTDRLVHHVNTKNA